MSYICELRLVSKYTGLTGTEHADVFWNYASYITDDLKIKQMREKARQASIDSCKGTISFERMTRNKNGYYWRVLNEFYNGEDNTP